MRMHRGSSKDAGRGPPASGSLPLSASRATVRVTVELARAGAPSVRRLSVPAGTLVREVLHRLELAPEGSAVLIRGTSVPLDLPLDVAVTITVVPTFSGG
jgi:sulfur carrier protein ThiS